MSINKTSQANPFVSVVLPVYNCEKFVGIAIESILNQTYSNFELIILNDGSTDKSLQVINLYNDERIKLIDKKNSGLAATLNDGIAVATGKYIARMDHDDIAHPQRLEKQVIYMENHPEIDLTDTLVIQIDEEGNEIQKVHKKMYTSWNEYKHTYVRGMNAFHPTLMVKAAVMKEFKYTSKYYEDYYLLLQLINAGKSFYKIPEFLLQYRILSTSMVNTDVNSSVFIKKVIKTKQEYLKGLGAKEYFKLFNIKFLFFLQMNKLKSVLKNAG